MTRDCIAELVARGEGATIEFRRSLSRDVGREMCAFANAGGGTILIGVTNAGDVGGVTDHNGLKSRVLSTARSADAANEIKVESVGAVLCGIARPHRRTPHSFGGWFFMRDGANSHQMSNAEVVDLFYAAGRQHFDRKPCADFSVENDLNEETWAQFSGRAKVAAAMERLVARDIRRFTITAHVSCAPFMGTEKGRILDRRDFHRDIPTLIDDAVAWMLTKINVEFIIKQVRRQERPESPEAALREAVTNAGAHRDYRSTANIEICVFKDRLEVVSPGGLPNRMTVADPGTKNLPWNPPWFGILYKLAVVENIDSGVKRIRGLCREYGVAEPIFNWVRTLGDRDVSAAGRDRRQGRCPTGRARIQSTARVEAGTRARVEGARTRVDETKARVHGTGMESLDRRVLAVLPTDPLSMAAVADGRGHQPVSASLNRVIRCLVQDGRVAYTVPDKPNRRLQEYRITQAGQSAIKGTGKWTPRCTPRTPSSSRPRSTTWTTRRGYCSVMSY